MLLDLEQEMTMHCIIDIETLGVTPGSCILSISAVCGNDSFSKAIDLGSHPGTICRETLKWWFSDKVSDNARTISLFSPRHECSLRECLESLVEFIESHTNAIYFWAQGPVFDYGHLEYWLKHYDLPIPWQYYQIRDIRTIQGFIPLVKLDQLVSSRPNDKHTSLGDAKYEQLVLKTFIEMIENAQK